MDSGITQAWANGQPFVVQALACLLVRVWIQSSRTPGRLAMVQRLSQSARECPSGYWNPIELVRTDSAWPSTWATLARPT